MIISFFFKIFFGLLKYWFDKIFYQTNIYDIKMYTSIYQNSYIILLITFVMLSVICYLLQIGYTTEIKDGKIIKKFSWKYPLAISLIVWIIWHFLLFPSKEETVTDQPSNMINYNMQNTSSSSKELFAKTNRLVSQKINMANWN